MVLGEKLKKLRQLKGMNRSELAEALGIHYSHIGRYEKNAQAPSLDTAVKMAKIFDVTVDHLVSEDGDRTVKTSFENQELLSQFKKAEQLPESQKNILIDLVDAYLLKNNIQKLIK